jgi:hypothetical protein
MAVGAIRLLSGNPIAQVGTGAIDWIALVDKGGVIAVLAVFCWLLYKNDMASRKKFDKQQELIIRALEQSTASHQRVAQAIEFCEEHNTKLMSVAHSDANRAHMDAGDAREELFRQERKQAARFGRRASNLGGQ